MLGQEKPVYTGCDRLGHVRTDSVFLQDVEPGYNMLGHVRSN